IPSHEPAESAGSGGGTPVYDLGRAWPADPTTDGGTPVSFSDIQTQLDTMGCTTSACHGGTQVPVLMPKPAASLARLNYYDLLSGCANGMPDPSDCVDPIGVDDSLLLAKTCAASGVTHAGGFAFQDANDPMYQLWRGWIAAGAPY
ncbi:MAG TPA: hypothetical protein VGL86_23150, partial [Polyangia bacterium]